MTLLHLGIANGNNIVISDNVCCHFIVDISLVTGGQGIVLLFTHLPSVCVTAVLKSSGDLRTTAQHENIGYLHCIPV